MNGVLPYLDINIHRTAEGFLTSVYRKFTSTDQAVPPSSFSDPAHRRAAIVSDVTRAWRYCSSDRLRKAEIDHIFRKYRANGYTAQFIKRAIRDTTTRMETGPAAPDGGPKPVRVSLPYCGSTYHALRRLAAPLGIQFVSKPTTTVAGLLCSRNKHQLPTHQQSRVVYKISCSCAAVYVGETEREVGVVGEGRGRAGCGRVAEHKRGWRLGQASSPFGSHQHCRPGPDFAGVEVLAHESHHCIRLLSESAYIRTVGNRETVIKSPNDANLNRNAGTLLHDRWLPALISAEESEGRGHQTPHTS